MDNFLCGVWSQKVFDSLPADPVRLCSQAKEGSSEVRTITVLQLLRLRGHAAQGANPASRILLYGNKTRKELPSRNKKAGIGSKG
jgi:hypothetical protein